MHRRIISALALVGLLAACSPASNAPDYDPWEPMNRQIFAFNEVVDGAIIEPAARGYRYVMPEAGRKGVDNFLKNLGEPVNMLNAALQGEGTQAMKSFWRFILNTTFGLAGFTDFAGEYGNLPYQKEDFGQTLAVWGVDSGPYLVLPILGPSSVRGVSGRVVDGFTDPFNYVLADPDVCDGDDCLLLRGVVTGLVEREKLLDTMDAVYEDSFDPYATIRSAYVQKRNALIKNREPKGPLAE